MGRGSDRIGRHGGRVGLAWLAAVAALLVPTSPAAAQQGGDSCLETDPPPVSAPPQPLRFGITPGIAGSAGALQEQAPPVDQPRTIAALLGLRPPGKELVLRLNRMFWADGDEAIREFAERVDAYGRAGLRSEVQVRYHPPEGKEGDIAAWVQWVRQAVRELGRRPSVIGFTITNEANFAASPNTSDGAYEGVIDALVAGVAAAKEELDRLGRTGVDLGFNVMWRSAPDSDARFWTQLGQKATPAFRAALTNVGLQVYPGLVWPPVPLPGRSAGDEVLEALTLVRDCYMPKAKLGRDVELWLSENGYATNLGRTEPDQAAALDSTVRALHAWSGTLGVTDYRWFNLRDNNSDGRDLFSAVGLLRDDYTPKPAYATYRGLAGLFGRDVPTGGGLSARARARLRARTGPRADLRGPRRFRTTGRLVLPAGVRAAEGCRGRVSVRFRAARRTVSSRRVRVRRDCSFASRVEFRMPSRFGAARRLTVGALFQGNRVLTPASASRASVRVR